MSGHRLNRRLEPDFGRLRKVLTRDGLPDRVPFAELYFDQAAIASLLGETPVEDSDTDRARMEECWRQRIRFCRRIGLDFVPINVSGSTWERLKRNRKMEATDPLLGRRAWVAEDRGLITTLEEFERFRWPAASDLLFEPLEFLSRCLPDGMKVIACTDGPFEIVRELMGFQTFAFALHEQPELVSRLFQRVGELLLHLHRRIVQFEAVGATQTGDDMCYKSGPMISPALMREHVFPWHRRFAEIAHARGLPFLLHSDGNHTLLMDDLLNVVRIDAKHAFEDAAEPVESFKRRYGRRLALIGGMDIHFLCSADEAALRKRTHRMIEVCGEGGGFAFGSGNSLASYVPAGRYMAMLNAALEVAWY